MTGGQQTTPSEGKTLRILLVVPNRNFQATLRRILGRCGYRVDYASSGEEAMQMLEAARYDAVVTDVHLPGQLCGITLMQRLREAGREVPIFFLTEEETSRIRAALDSTTDATCMRLPLDIDRLKKLIAARCGVEP